MCASIARRAAWPSAQFNVASHPRFKRRGADIVAPLELRLSEALLGCAREVETAWGKARVTVPPGTRPGATIALEGQGAPIVNSRGRGRHILEVTISLPRQLTAEQAALVQQLRKTGL